MKFNSTFARQSQVSISVVRPFQFLPAEDETREMNLPMQAGSKGAG